jgi:PAS domain S-box-containing protein
VLTNATVMSDDDGNYIMSRSTLYDITQLKQVERALRESEEKFRLMIESAPLATVITDQSGTIILANKQSKTLFGYEQDELVGQPIEILLPESMRHGHVAKRDTYITSNTTEPSVHITKELIAVRKDGSHCPVEIELSRIETQAGKLVMSFIMDISERKEQERQLRFNASLQESVTDAVVSTDMNFTIQSWNIAAERIYGWRADEVIGRNVTDVFKTRSELDYPLQHFEHDLLMNGKWQREVVNQRKDGSEIYVLTSINLLKDEHNNPIGTVGVNHDITARKQADEALQLKIEDELEFQIYLKALHDITIALTQVDQLDDFYRKTVEFGLERLGFDRVALFLYDKENNLALGTYGTDINGNVNDEHAIRFTPGNEGVMMRALQRSERFCFDENTELRTALHVVGKGWNASAVLWNGAQSIGWLVADNFIQHRPASKALLDTLALYAMTVGTLVARKQSDAAMRESESRYRLLAQNISDVIIRLDTSGHILYVSPSSLRMLGYRPEEMVGRDGLEFLNPTDLAAAMSRITHATDGTAPTESLLFRFQHKQGHLIWIEATGQMIMSPETGELLEFVASLRDISERKQAEEAVRQALTKEKELGELKSRFVSMASHEFRTPLANIMATTETLSSYRKKMSDQQIEDRLNNVRGQVDHLKDIMDDVLQLSRIQAKRVEFNPQPLNLEALCREIVGEFQARSDIGNPLVFTAQNVPTAINLDRKLMRQIINNLISNAVKYSAADKPVHMDLNCVDNICSLRIVDQGIGIPEADLKHLFEPFHRATNVGTISGTGLGLIITREAVELHGGTISIQSRVDYGTTITIEIPMDSSKENESDQDTSN